MTNDVETGGFTSWVKVGHPAPDYEFEAYHDGAVKKVRIGDYTDKWLVVVFYPADFTFVCPTELEQLADLYPEFQKLDTEVISISTDTVFAHKAWHDTLPAISKIKFPMGADPSGRVARAFGTLIENRGTGHIDDEGLSLRGTFIIDPDGIVRSADIHDNGVGRSGTELLRTLQATQFVRTNGGQVCPAEWKPGDPGIDNKKK